MLGTAKKITKYEPKDLTVETNSKTSTILLLNDKIDHDWKVLVDQKPAELLRCNYIMRGVFVPLSRTRLKIFTSDRRSGF